MDILISDRGGVWSLSGQDLPKPPALMVRRTTNLPVGHGPIYTRVFVKDSRARIALGDGPLTQACFERIIWVLVHCQVERAVVERDSAAALGAQSVPELLTSLQDIVARLDEWRGEAPGATPRPAFFLERMSIDRLSDSRRASLNHTYGTWLKARGRLTRAEIRRRAGQVKGERMLMRVETVDRLEVMAVMNTLGIYRPCHRLQMLGRDIQDQPDSLYGEFLSQPYRDLATGEEPSLELVEAVISPPGAPTVRSRYERLMLPWESSGGERWITTSAVPRARRERS